MTETRIVDRLTSNDPPKEKYKSQILNSLENFFNENASNEQSRNPNVSEEAKKELIDGVNEFIDLVFETGFSEQDLMQVMAALELALEAHSGQKPRPDGKQYALHPIGVAKSVLEMLEQPDANVVVAGLLHDTIEDQSKILSGKNSRDYSQNEIVPSERERALSFVEDSFGEDVASMVHALSNPEPSLELDNLNEEAKQAEKNRIYRVHVEKIINISDAVFIVKLLDFNDNALRLGEITKGKIGEDLTNAQAKLTKLSRKYLPVIELMLNRLEKPLVTQLIKKEKLAELINKLKTAQREIEDYLNNE